MSLYTERIQQLLIAARDLPEVVLDNLRTTLEFLDRVMSSEDVLAVYSAYQSLTAAVEEGLETLTILMRESDFEGLMQWNVIYATKIRDVLASLTTYDDSDEVTPVYLDSTFLVQQVSTARDLHRITSRATEALGEAITAQELATEAAGTTGTNSLAKFFQDYGNAEGRSSLALRIASITLVLIGVGAAVFFPRGATEFYFVPSDPWQNLIVRLSVLAGLSGLATYLGRLSGQHRRNHNWARSVETQLKTFPAFVAPLSDEAADDIYRAFARRVLGAPPEKGVEQGDDALPASQLIDLVTALAKRQP